MNIVHGTVTKVEGKCVTFTTMENNESTSLEFDVITLCTGLRANSSFMMKSMSHALDDQDRIRVNASFRVLKSVTGDDQSSSSSSTSFDDTEPDNGAQYYRNIFAVGGVSTIVSSYKNPFSSISHGIRCCTIVSLMEMSQEVKNHVVHWSDKKEPYIVSCGPKRAISVVDGEVIMNNYIAVMARNSTVSRISNLLSGPSKKSLKGMFALHSFQTYWKNS